jgi:hypothetical protein
VRPGESAVPVQTSLNLGLGFEKEQHNNTGNAICLAEHGDERLRTFQLFWHKSHKPGGILFERKVESIMLPDR